MVSGQIGEGGLVVNLVAEKASKRGFEPATVQHQSMEVNHVPDLQWRKSHAQMIAQVSFLKDSNLPICFSDSAI